MCRPCKLQAEDGHGRGGGDSRLSPAATPLAASRIKSGRRRRRGRRGVGFRVGLRRGGAHALIGRRRTIRPKPEPRARPWRPARRPPRTRIPPRRRLPASAARRLTRTPTPPSPGAASTARRVRFGSLGFTLRPPCEGAYSAGWRSRASAARRAATRARAASRFWTSPFRFRPRFRTDPPVRTRVRL